MRQEHAESHTDDEVENALLARGEIRQLEIRVGEFREMVAREYATITAIAGVKAEVVAEVRELSKRLDRVLEARPPN